MFVTTQVFIAMKITIQPDKFCSEFHFGGGLEKASTNERPSPGVGQRRKVETDALPRALPRGRIERVIIRDHTRKYRALINQFKSISH